MINWQDEGEILRSDDVKWGRPEGGFMWAPDCAYKNGTYYFYYPHPSGTKWNDTWKIGVATSKHPAKDFVDQGYIEGLGGFAMIDPCVFADDDGKYYIYTGGGSRCEGAELNDDMTSTKKSVEMTGLEDFHEATWVFKRNGVYYLIYSDNLHGKNQMSYAVSNKPLGPWEYKGIFLEPTDCDTSHGSVAEYKGQWYLFYHNCNISGRGNLRSVCVDYLYFNGDGTIKTVVQTKKDGIKSAGSAPDLSNAKKYEKECGGVTISAGTNNNFPNIDGGKGGRASVYINYSTDAELAKVNLTVNDTDWSLLNMPKAEGCAYITVKLNPGKNNSIIITGAEESVTINYIAVNLLD
jgi:beta-xylosidase